MMCTTHCGSRWGDVGHMLRCRRRANEIEKKVLTRFYCGVPSRISQFCYKSKSHDIFKSKKISNLNLKLYNSDIELVKNYTFLGFILDKQLEWSPHIKKCTKNVQGI